MPCRVGVCQRIVQRIGVAVQVLRGNRAVAGAMSHPLRYRIARPDGERRVGGDGSCKLVYHPSGNSDNA